MQQFCWHSSQLVRDIHAQFAFESVEFLVGGIVQSKPCRDERGGREKAVDRVDSTATGTKLLARVVGLGCG